MYLCMEGFSGHGRVDYVSYDTGGAAAASRHTTPHPATFSFLLALCGFAATMVKDEDEDADGHESTLWSRPGRSFLGPPADTD